MSGPGRGSQTSTPLPTSPLPSRSSPDRYRKDSRSGDVISSYKTKRNQKREPEGPVRLHRSKTPDITGIANRCFRLESQSSLEKEETPGGFGRKGRRRNCYKRKNFFNTTKFFKFFVKNITKITFYLISNLFTCFERGS